MKFIKKLGEGVCSVALLYKDENGQKIVVRKPKPDYPEKDPFVRYRREACMTQGLKRMGLDKVNVSVTHVNRENGQWQIVSNFVEGEPLTSELFEKLPKDEQEKIIDDFADFLLKLHTLCVTRCNEKFSDLVTKEPHIIRYYSAAFYHALYSVKKTYFSYNSREGNILKRPKFEKMKQKIYRSYDISLKYRNLFEEIIDMISLDPESFKYFGVCHGDFTPNNVLYDRATHMLGIIDFGCANYKGNIYQEFGAILSCRGENFTKRLIDRYNMLAKEHGIDIHIKFDLVKLWKVVISLIKITTGQNISQFIGILDNFASEKR